jgi:hypothetical protein
MTAILSTIEGRRTTTRRLHQLAHMVTRVLATIGAWWNDLVDAGQLGTSDQTLISRHTGARI